MASGTAVTPGAAWPWDIREAEDAPRPRCPSPGRHLSPTAALSRQLRETGSTTYWVVSEQTRPLPCPRGVRDESHA